MERITYIFNGMEYYLTGRVATKNSDKISFSDIRYVEIKPLNEDTDDYNKWVHSDQLFVVKRVDELEQ